MELTIPSCARSRPIGYRLRDIEAERKFSQQLQLEALEAAIPQASIDGALQAAGVCTARERKLSLSMTVWMLIGMNLFTRVCIKHVLHRLCQGLRYVWPTAGYVLPGNSAVSYRRSQLLIVE